MAAPVTKQQDIDVSLPQSSSLNDETLKIMNFYGTSQVAPKAQRLYKTIPVTVTDTDKGQIVILADSDDNPLFFSYLESSEGTVTISSEGIARGLIWMNPYVMVLPSDQKKQFMEEAVISNLFSQLKVKIDNLLVTDPKNLLDPDNHPEVVKTAFAIVKETFETLGAQQPPKTYKDIGASGDLRVLDKDGNDVGFENPKMTAYGVEAIDSSNHKTNILVKGKEGFVTWGWPFLMKITPPEVEIENFPDDTYSVKFYKGFNTDVANWWLPYIPGSSVQFSSDATIVGTATWYNGFDAMGIIVETISGLSINKKVGIGRIAKDASKINGLTDFAVAIGSGDPIKTFESIVKLMADKDNWKIFANAIWGAFGPDSQIFLHASKALIKNIAGALKAVDWANHHIPFLYDLGFAPWEVEYCVEQTSGILDECSNFVPLIPPTAVLSASPTNPYVGDNLTFDASGSTDDRTADLEYRFDFDSDGSWDTSWAYDDTVTYTYQTSGNYNARVEVKDEDGLTATANYYLMVYERSQAVSTAIVIDRSGSMGWDTPPAIDGAKDAAKTYIACMGTADRAAIISFSSDVTVDQPFTDDLSLLTAAIDALQTTGGTHFYDGTYTAITETKNEDSSRRRAIIALTDGWTYDDLYKQSIEKFQDVVAYAKQEGIPVYTIGLGSSIDESMLQDLATQTNGLYFYAPDSSQLKKIYDTIAGIQ